MITEYRLILMNSDLFMMLQKNGIDNESMIVISPDNVDSSLKHLIHGGNQLHVVLSRLFNTMLIHGYTPSTLLKSNILSISKD